MTRALFASQGLLATYYAWCAGSETAEESPQALRGAPLRATAAVRSPGITLQVYLHFQL